MMGPQRPAYSSIWPALAIALGVFATDVLTPPGFAHGMLYLPCILYTALRRSSRALAGMTVLCSVLLVGVIPLFPPLEPALYDIVLLNRTMTLGLLAATATSCVHFIRLLEARAEALHESTRIRSELEDEQRLRRIACEAATMGGYVVDLETMRTDLSDEVAIIQGRQPGFRPTVDEAIDIYAPEYRERIRHLFDQCVLHGTPFDDELQIIDGHGKRLWVRAIGRAVRDEGGVVRRVQGAFMDISERKALQLTLAESERWFHQVADSLPLFIWTAAADGRFEYASQQVRTHGGQAWNEVVTSDGWSALIHPDDRAGALAAWHRSVSTGEPFSAEMRLQHDGDGYRWYLARAVAVRDGEGRVQRWVGSGIDIHDRKGIEQTAQRLAERLTTTLQSITEGFFLLDRQWRFSFLNERAEALLGRDRDELIGRNIWEAYAPARGTVFESEYRRAVETETATTFASFYPPLDKWFEVHAYPSAEGLAVYFQDITARKKDEASLRLLEAAIERINDIVLITDASPIDHPGPRIVFVNQAFERRLGYRKEQVLGSTPRMLQGAETSATERARIRAALERGQPVRSQLVNYTASGERLVLELDIVPMLDAEGHTTHFVSVERDITERLALETRLQQAQRMEAIGQLTGGLAHDLNNLLTVIIGNGELLDEELRGDVRQGELSAMIVQAADKAATLVQRLMAFARQQMLEPQSVDVVALVADMSALLRRALGEHVELSFEHPGSVPPALVDPVQLETALLNLCINARDAMPRGGTLAIELSAAKIDSPGNAWELDPGQYVVLVIRDDGDGIAAADLPRVFDPFFTTKQRSGGTGLGLSMVYGFARQSKGLVTIDSRPGAGTCVTLYLPAATTLPAAARPRAAEPLAIEPPACARILLVEDNPLVRNFACGQLRGLGYEVVEVDHAAAALSLLESPAPFDLLFTDIVMPGGVSGVELATRAKALRPDLPVLLTSGFTDDELKDSGSRLGSVLVKPYRPHELAAQVRAALAGHRSPGGDR